jgi:hypothetical protein
VSDLLINSLSMIRVLFTFFFLYFILPAGIFRHKDDSVYDLGFLDKMFIYLTHTNIVTIVIVYLLALIRVYETFSLILVYVSIILIYIWIKNRKQGVHLGDIGTHYGGKVLDLIETKGTLKKSLAHGIKQVFLSPIRAVASLFRIFIKHPIEGVILTALFGLGAYMRFGHSFIYSYYGASDPYVHLAWVKYLGNNIIFRDGVYPQGYHAILSALNKIFFTDPSVIIRFIGPIVGSMIIISLFYVLQKHFKNSLIPAILGVGAYVLNTILPQSELRQISALSEEYAMMFLLPGMYFLNMFFISKKKYFLFLAAEVLMLTLLIHLYVPIFLVAGYILLCIVHFRTFFKPGVFFRFAGWMTAAGLLGLLPIGLGLLAGMELHAPSIEFIRESAGTSPVPFSLAHTIQYIGNDQIFIGLLVSICVLLLISFVWLFVKNIEHKMQARLGVAFVILTFLLYLQYRGPYMGIPIVMDITRTGKFLTLVGITSLALLVGAVDYLTSRKFLQIILKITLSAIILLTVFQYPKFKAPIEAPIADRMEYEEAATTTSTIKNQYPAFSWTIVSPIEQYAHVMNYGFHYNTWEYVKKFESEEKLEIPTEYIFWYVEIIPLNTSQKITPEDAIKPFPVIEGLLDEYYTEEENRRVIMAKAFYILETELARNPNMQVFKETEEMKIYVLRQLQYAVGE